MPRAEPTRASAQLQGHEARARDRRFVIRRNVVKAERDVERLRVAHHRQCVEPHLAVLQLPRLVDHTRDQLPREAAAARLGTHEQPLHLASRRVVRSGEAGAFIERAQPDHPDEIPAIVRNEQRAARRRVIAGQAIELVVDFLERQIEADPGDVVAQHGADGGDVCRRGGANVHVFQPEPSLYSLLGVTAAELALPMLMVRDAQPAAANPEVVRLVALARTGDRAAFGRLLEDHLTAARRLALAAVGQPTDADEAVQEASVAAWMRLHALQDPAAFRSWFMRIVWRKAIDRRRSLRTWLDRFGASASDEQRPLEFAAADPSPDAQLISRELATAITQVVKALPRKLRDPFLLAASGDHRYEEIAALLDIPIGTVKWRISEARRMIRVKLDRLGHGDPR